MAKLDSLIIDLQLNTAELKKGLDEANTKLSDFGKKMDNLAGVITFEKIGGMALQAGQSLATFVMHGAETVDKMGKMAQSAGVSVESFSQINYAASLADVSTEQLGTAMAKLNQNITKAATGQQEQVSLFKELGVSITDSSGKVRTADAVMGDLAEAFAGMEGGAAKATLAGDVFGKNLGAQLLPMLNGGRQGLKDAAAEADRFGLTVSGSAARAAEELNDNLTRMKSVLDAVAQRVAAAVAPAMSVLANELLNTKEGSDTLKGAVDALSIVLKTVLSAGVVVAAVFEALGKTIARVASAVMNAAKGNFQDAFEDMKGQFSDAADAANTAATRIAGIWSDASESVSDSSDKSAESAKKNAEKITAALEADKKAATDFKTAMASLTKVAEDYETKVASFGSGELGLLEARLNSGDLADELVKVGESADEARARIYEAAQALNDLKIDLKMDEIKFTIQRAGIASDQDASNRRDNFSRASTPVVGNFASQVESAKFDTKGFADFNAALNALAVQTKTNAKLLGDAELLKEQNDIEGANAALLSADAAKLAADKAGLAADAFTELAAGLINARDKSIKEAASAGSWGEAMKILESNFKAAINNIPDFGAELEVWFKRMSGQLGKAGQKLLGAVGDLVDSVVKGAESGGIWGAVIAAFMEIAQKTASALKFLDTAMQFIEKIAAMVEPLVEPIFKALQGVLEIVIDIIAPVFTALQPFFNAISQLIEDLSPIIWAIGDLFAALSPIIEFIGMLVGKIFEVLKPIFTIIAGFIRVIATVILGIIIALNEIAAAFGDKKAAEEVTRMRALVDQMWGEGSVGGGTTTTNLDARPEVKTGPVTATGAITATGTVDMKNFDLSDYGVGGPQMDVIDIGGWGYAAGSIAGAEAARAFVEAAAIMNGATAEAGAAAGEAAYADFLDLGTAAGEAASSLNKFSESLTNVPVGFKYALGKFNAMNEEGGEGSLGGGGSGTMIIVQGSVIAENQLLGMVEASKKKSAFRKTGVGG